VSGFSQKSILITRLEQRFVIFIKSIITDHFTQKVFYFKQWNMVCDKAAMKSVFATLYFIGCK
jgi:hypothetical protein